MKANERYFKYLQYDDYFLEKVKEVDRVLKSMQNINYV